MRNQTNRLKQFFISTASVGRFKTYTTRNRIMNYLKYDAPAKPYDSIEIEAEDIDYKIGQYLTPLKFVNHSGLGRTLDGPWDCPENRREIESIKPIYGMIQRFKKGMDWKETVYYQELYDEHRDEFEKFEEFEQFTEEIFNRYDNLFRKIKSSGYQPNHKGRTLMPGFNQAVTDRLEVLVTIGRNGEIYFFEGHHRFAIAWVLELTIPVQVAYRHEQWQAVRDKVYNSGIYKIHGKIRDHPDLQDIINCQSQPVSE